jgi:YD repeat-containing protein
MIRALLFAALLTSVADEAGAGERTIYGPDGRVQAREATGPKGDTTLYGADGRVLGRSATSGATTTFYGADGRKVGTEVRR